MGADRRWVGASGWPVQAGRQDVAEWRAAGKNRTVKPGPPSKPLPAQGSGNHKRTPSSAFDPAAGNDIYEPEEIVGERQKNMGGGKTVTQYEVKWKGYDSEHNTYEPIAHLAGCEDMIAEYIKSEKDSTLEHPLFAAFDCE